MLTPVLATLWLAANPTCADRASAVIAGAERLPLVKRSAYILLQLRRDTTLGCGVVPSKHWKWARKATVDCKQSPEPGCQALAEMKLPRALVKAVPPIMLVRMADATAQLRAAGRMTARHRRLFDMMILFEAKLRSR